MKKVIIIGSILLLFIGLSITSSIDGYIGSASNQLTKGAHANNPLNAGELAWWKSDECDGTTLWDCSNHNHHGTIYGADWTPGCCLVFDGVDDYVDFDNHSVALGLNKTDDYIVMLRFKSTGSGMFYSMSHTDPDGRYFNLGLDLDGKITVSIGASTGLLNLSTSGSYNDGDWHLVKMNFWGSSSNPTLEIWLDGELVGSKTGWLPPMLNEDFKTAKMGRKSITTTNYFNGIINEVKIYKWPAWYGPPSNPTIYGQKNGNAGTPYEYTFTSTDADGDYIQYYIRWGDGTESGWTPIQPGGIPYKEDHIYGVGTYTIQAQAKDETGLTSGWSYYTVKMPRNKGINNALLQRLLERFPIIQKLIFLI